MVPLTKYGGRDEVGTSRIRLIEKFGEWCSNIPKKMSIYWRGGGLETIDETVANASTHTEWQLLQNTFEHEQLGLWNSSVSVSPRHP